MNAFLSLLRSVVENLPNQSPAARADVYSRARDKLIVQLEKVDPPLSEEQIQRQVLKMRDAIVLIEKDFTNGTGTSKATKPSG